MSLKPLKRRRIGIAWAVAHERPESLGQEQECNQEQGSAKDEKDPKDPTPRYSLRNDTAENGADYKTKHLACRVHPKIRSASFLKCMVSYSGAWTIL